VWDQTVRKEVFEDYVTDPKDSGSFIDDHMNKWPVIWVSMYSVRFGSPSPSLSEIQEKLSIKVVQQTFKEHEDVLFILMVEKACSLKYKEVTRETFLKILKDHKIEEQKSLSAKIGILWDNYGKEMDPDIQKFYKFYRGMPPFDSVTDSFKLLSEILHEFYGRKVIVLVDEHDAPVQDMYSEISLDNPEGNADIITSINNYSKTLAKLLGDVCKDNEMNTERFLMCGVSNSVIDAPYSAFNILDKYNALNSRFAKFF
jgi:hypothetical protein